MTWLKIMFRGSYCNALPVHLLSRSLFVSLHHVCHSPSLCAACIMTRYYYCTRRTMTDPVRSPGPASSLSLHQRSPSPFLLDSIIITPHTCAPPHQIPSWSQSSVDYLDTSLPSLCLARLPTLICVSMFVHCVFL